MKKMIKQVLPLVLVFLGCLAGTATYGAYIDGIVAVVEDDIILESELRGRVATIIKNLESNNVDLPPISVIRKQVLDGLIVLKLKSQLADRIGIRVTSQVLSNAVSEIAQRNNLSLEEFQEQFVQQGLSFQKFVESIRTEITNNQLRAGQISNQIKVSEREISHHLETEGQEDKIQYHIAHILITTPDPATPDQVRAARIKAQTIVKDLRNGKDFKQTAIAVSHGPQALSGGDLGWRSISQVPSMFAAHVTKLSPGDIGDPIHSPSGFHIIKILELHGISKRMITQTNARHILVKLNELINDKEAKDRLLKIKDRIGHGEDFAALARAHSDDKVSAAKGGSLNWVSPGFLVPPFEQVMNKLAINEISNPVQTQFGWHMIQVLDRQERDNSEQYRRNQVREQLRSRKIEEETELWLRKLRNEAFVQIRSDKL